MTRKILLVVGMLTAMSGAPSLAHACSCAYSGPPCQAFWTADAVLDATVVELRRLPRERRTTQAAPVFHDDTVVSLQVHAAYKGAEPGSLDVTTYSDGAGCGYSFKAGSRYLIFARRAPTGGLTVSLCSATREFDGKGPAAAFLASLSQPATGGRIFGTVHTSSGNMSAAGRVPFETEIRLSGPDGTRTTRSIGGQYEFPGVQVGTYHLESTVPEGYARSYATQRVEIPDARGCAEWNVTFSPAGRITGRVVDRDGRPLSKLWVEVVAADATPTQYGLSPRTNWSSVDGSFEFEGLGPGRYIVGINLNDLPSQYKPYARTVYPGSGLEPHVIELTLGQAVDLGVWTLPPPLAVVEVSGIVVRPDGSALANVYVGSWDETGNPVAQARGAGGSQTGPDGRFTLQLRQGRTYTFMVRAGNGPPLRIEAPRIDTSSGTPHSIRIVVLDFR